MLSSVLRILKYLTFNWRLEGFFFSSFQVTSFNPRLQVSPSNRPPNYKYVYHLIHKFDFILVRNVGFENTALTG